MSSFVLRSFIYCLGFIASNFVLHVFCSGFLYFFYCRLKLHERDMFQFKNNDKRASVISVFNEEWPLLFAFLKKSFIKHTPLLILIMEKQIHFLNSCIFFFLLITNKIQKHHDWIQTLEVQMLLLHIYFGMLCTWHFAISMRFAEVSSASSCGFIMMIFVPAAINQVCLSTRAGELRCS